MDVIKGKTLRKQDRSTTLDAESVLKDKKLVLFYFSAHWCPPCRLFTPILKDFYADASKEGVEIVFVSSDRSAEDMDKYMRDAHGNWWAVEHSSEETQALKKKFSISAVPTLVVVRCSDGHVITMEGRGHVQSEGAKAVKKWLSM